MRPIAVTVQVISNYHNNPEIQNDAFQKGKFVGDRICKYLGEDVGRFMGGLTAANEALNLSIAKTVTDTGEAIADIPGDIADAATGAAVHIKETFKAASGYRGPFHMWGP